MRRLAIIVLLFGVSGTGAALAQNPYAPLAEGEGARETFAFCSPCHSAQIVAQQGLNRQAWDDMLVWMVEEQGMAEIPEPMRTVILDYLEKNYNEDRPNFPGR